MGSSRADFARIIAERQSKPLEVNVVDSMRDDLDKGQRHAAMICVLRSPDIGPERRTMLLRKYARDNDVDIQRSALSTIGHWESDSIAFLRSLKCNSENEFYRLRALAWSGDVQVLEHCYRIAKSGEGYTDAIPICEAALLAADLGTAEAIGFLRSLFSSVSRDYERVILALCLSRCGAHDGVSFLEEKLDDSTATTGVLIAAALAVARSPRGIAKVEDILARGEHREMQMLRQFLFMLKVPAAEEPEWQESIRTWLKEEER